MDVCERQVHKIIGDRTREGGRNNDGEIGSGVPGEMRGFMEACCAGGSHVRRVTSTWPDPEVVIQNALAEMREFCESIRFQGARHGNFGDGPTSSINRDLPIASRAGRDQPDDLAALAGLQ